MLVLYKQLIQTGSVLLLLLLSSVLGFPLYEDTANGRAATHQLNSFVKEVWYAPMDTATHLFVCLFVYYAKRHGLCSPFRLSIRLCISSNDFDW